MSAAYRDYELGSDRRGGGRRWIVLLAVLAGLGVAGWWGASQVLGSYRALRAGVKLAREGKLAEAEARFESLRAHRYFGAAARDGLGLVALLKGDVEEARKRFAAAGPAEVRFWPVDYDELIVDLLGKGDYARAEVLAEHARARKDSPALRMFHGIAFNGLDKLGPAREAMAGGPLRSVFERVKRGDTLLVGGVFQNKDVLALYANHVRALVDKERSGRRSFLYDRNGKPLASVSVKTQEPMPLKPAIEVAVYGPEGFDGGIDRWLSDLDRHNRIETTLDPEMQTVAYEALRNYRGAAVILNLDGEVLAAAGRDGGNRSSRRSRAARAAPAEREIPDPFSTLFETASVAKIPTLAAALASPGLVESVFPFHCRGNLRLEGRPFYDSRSHGEVPDVGRALAVSCNLAFADLALKLGTEKVVASFHAFGFDRAPEGALVPRPLGAFARSVTGDRATAELAVGFDIPRTTTVGAAAVALAIATRGEYREPWMIRRKVTIGGLVYATGEGARRTAVSEAVAAGVTAAMVRVVSDEEGTGRRAKLDDMSIAAKTGTSGSDKTGYDAVMVGFFPAEAPRHVFAVVLVGGGRAEWDAAFAVKTLVEGVGAVEAERRRTAPR